MKKITLFGTKHHQAGKAPPGIREAIEFLVEEVEPEAVLEEWSKTQPQSLASVVAKGRGIPWEDIGTPNTAEFKTYDHTHALDFPGGPAKLRQHGPIDVQEKREAAMCENIRKSMSARQVALFVLGMAHLHSMFVKLAKDFDVSAYGFTDDFF
jgi:hypothetical protein